MKHLFFALLCINLPAHALDYINTKDGGRITGMIEYITKETIVIDTDYAGKITLQRDKINSFTTEQALTIRLQNQTTLSGQITQDSDGQLAIKSTTTESNIELQHIAESWRITDPDPQLARDKAAQAQWYYKAGIDLSGKDGNSDETTLVLNGEVIRETANDLLQIQGEIETDRDNGDTTDTFLLSAEYTHKLTDKWGWYARSRFERDDDDNLELRSILSAGLNYHVPGLQPKRTLDLRAGLGYRHEKFNDGQTEQSPSLDFGLNHQWQFTNWAKMTNKLSYTPAIDDFNDYLITHDSSFEFPLGLSEQWSLSLGLQNEYNSIPAEGSENLDTSYYSRLELKWQ